MRSVPSSVESCAHRGSAHRRSIGMVLAMLVMSLTFLSNAAPAHAYIVGAHVALAVKVEQALPAGGRIRRAMANQPQMMAWGATGPDLPMAGIDYVLGRDGWSETYHWDRCGAYAEELMKEAIASNDDRKIAFAAGWITHMSGDFWTHGSNGDLDRKDLDPVVWRDFARMQDVDLPGIPRVYAPMAWTGDLPPDTNKLYSLFYVGGVPVNLGCDGVITTMNLKDPFGRIATMVANVNQKVILDAEGPLTLQTKYPFGPSKFAESTRVMATMLTAPQEWFSVQGGPVAGLYAFSRGEVGYYAKTYEQGRDDLIKAGNYERARRSFWLSHQLSVDLLEAAEDGDYSGFSRAWSLNDVPDNGRGIGILKVVVNTGNANIVPSWPWDAPHGPGTDCTVRFHARLRSGETTSWDLNLGASQLPKIPTNATGWEGRAWDSLRFAGLLLDPLGLVDLFDAYNDFEGGARDIYYLPTREKLAGHAASEIDQISLELLDDDHWWKDPTWDLYQVKVYANDEPIFTSSGWDHWTDPGDSRTTGDGNHFDAWTPPTAEQNARLQPLLNINETQSTLWNGRFDDWAELTTMDGALGQPEHWSITGSSRLVFGKDGSYAMQLVNPTAQAGEASSEVVVEPDRRYMLTGVCRRGNVATDAVVAAITYLDANGSVVGGDSLQAGTNGWAPPLGTWSGFSVAATTPASAVKARIRLILLGGKALTSAAPNATWDDISLIPSSPDNVSFERFTLDGPLGWWTESTDGTVSANTTTAISGETSARLINPIGSEYTTALHGDFIARPGKVYTITALARGTCAPNRALVSLQFYDANGQPVATPDKRTTNGTEWGTGLNAETPVTAQLDCLAPAGAVRGRVSLAIRMSGEVSFDDVAVTPNDTGWIEGVVRKSGASLRNVIGGVKVKLGNGRSTYTDAKGHYFIPGLKPGPYEVTFSSSAYHTVIGAATVVADSPAYCSVALTPAVGGVVGTVTDANRAKLAGVTVGWQPSDLESSSRTDTGGNYSIAGLSPGEYSVTFTKDGFAPKTATVNITADATSTVSVQLASAPTTGTLSGGVLSRGRAIRGATVRVTGPTPIRLLPTQTGSRGEFRVSDLGPGVYTVTGVAPGFAARSQTATVVAGQEAQLFLDLDPDGSTVACALTYQAGPGGIVIGSATQHMNAGSSGTTVTAVPMSGYHFVQWSDGLQTPERRDGNVVQDATYTASFSGGSQAARVAQPAFSLAGGAFVGSVDVTMTCGTPGAMIRYTTDGSPPTGASPVYVGPLHITTTTVLAAIAIRAGMDDSAVTSATFTAGLPAPVAEPVFTPAGGTYSGPQNVTITCATPGAGIRYTTDGSEPGAFSADYTGPVRVSANMTLRAIAYQVGMSASPVHSATYVIRTVFGLNRPVLSTSRPRVGRTFTISGTFPRAHVGRSTIVIQIQRYGGRRYSDYKPLTVAIGNGSAGFKLKTSLKRSGIYRVRVCHADAQHLSSATKWVGFTVK